MMETGPASHAACPDTTGHVLIVEDEARNRRLMRGLLESEGHRVSEAIDGKDALQKVAQLSPDTILLDVMMPELDGFEVCRRLRSNPAWSAIPVLIITALSDRDDRLRGIEAGATGFLTKPIDPTEVLLHVRNAVYAKRLLDRLQDSYDRLREAEAMRDSLVHMVVHDMRSPLLGITLNLDVVKLGLERLTEDQRAGMERARACCRDLSDMVNTLLDVSRLEGGQMALDHRQQDLRQTIEEALNSLWGLTSTHNVVFNPPATLVEAWHDPAVISRVVANLVGNAVRFTPPDSDVTVEATSQRGVAKVSVTDAGSGIPIEFQPRAFEKFTQLGVGGTRDVHSTGLGLAFCRLAVEAHGGQIGLTSPVTTHDIGQAGAGSCFWFTLPTDPDG